MGFDSITSDLRDILVEIESLSLADRERILHEMDEIDIIHGRVEDERDKFADEADAVPDEDGIIADDRGGLARELEPIFGAIVAGDLDRARGGVNALAGMLRGDDPIIVAIQRARARPRLFVNVAA